MRPGGPTAAGTRTAPRARPGGRGGAPAAAGQASCKVMRRAICSPEAPLMSGASGLQIARRLTLQLAWPAAAGAPPLPPGRALGAVRVPAAVGPPGRIQGLSAAVVHA